MSDAGDAIKKWAERHSGRGVDGGDSVSAAGDATKKWAAWADAAEEYAKAASVLEQIESRRPEAEVRLRAAIERLGCDPMNLLPEPPISAGVAS